MGGGTFLAGGFFPKGPEPPKIGEGGGKA